MYRVCVVTNNIVYKTKYLSTNTMYVHNTGKGGGGMLGLQPPLS